MFIYYLAEDKADLTALVIIVFKSTLSKAFFEKEFGIFNKCENSLKSLTSFTSEVFEFLLDPFMSLYDLQPLRQAAKSEITTSRHQLTYTL